MAKLLCSIKHEYIYITWLMHGHYLENKKHYCNSKDSQPASINSPTGDL